MSKEERKVPELRFKGFHDDWEQRKLNMVFQNFIVPMRDKPKIFSGDIPWTRIEDIQGRYLHGSTSGRYVSEDTVKSMNLKVIPKDSIIVSVSATFGVVAIVSNDLITNQTFIGLTPKPNYNIDFLYSFFKSSITRKKMRNESAGSTIFYITRKNIENMIGNFPSNEEQDKIGKFLKSLDTIIALHQRKTNTLETLRKAYLNVMFTSKSDSTPRLRFKTFTEAWEQRKLNTIVERITRKNKNNESTLPLTISAQDGLVDQNTYFNKQVASKDMSNYYLLKKGDFAYNKSYSNGFPLGTVKRLDKYDEGTLSSLYIVFRPKKVNSDFLSIYYDTNKWHREVMKLSAEGARNHGLLNIPVNSFFEKKIIIPIHEEEQLEIAKFLKRLEKIISIHQRKLHRLSKIKQVYLNKLFI